MKRKRITSLVIENKIIILISILYFLIRTWNLTLLPIFNDESIYIDWGWKETHIPGYLFYSLYDAKQPFLMWLFGISSSIFSDPLFASRFISVIAGYITLIGLYKIGKKYFSVYIAASASFLYIFIPIFSFYDRQALMESAITAIGVWVVYYTASIQSLSYKNFVKIGVILGVGYFIKSTTLVFILAYISIIFFLLFVSKGVRKQLLTCLFVSIGAFLSITFLLLLQPDFWKTLGTNSRFSFTVNELLHFPVNNWLLSFKGFMEIGFIFLTPLVFIPSIIGIYFLLRKKEESEKKIVLFWFFIITLSEIILVRSLSQRYTVPFLPYLLIFCSYFLSTIKNNLIKKLSLIIILLPMMILVFLQISNPINYLILSESKSAYADSNYVKGFTSGIGINQISSKLRYYAREKAIYVGIAKNIGNPENAMHILSNKNEKIKVGFLEASDLPTLINMYDCLQTDISLYYVARQDQLSGLGKFFSEVYQYKNPYSNYRITLYEAKKCNGKKLPITLINNP